MKKTLVSIEDKINNLIRNLSTFDSEVMTDSEYEQEVIDTIESVNLLIRQQILALLKEIEGEMPKRKSEKIKS